MREQTTSETAKQFSRFVIELRRKQSEGLPGFEFENVAVIIAQQAEHLSESFGHPAAFGLLTNLAKLTIGFRFAFEQKQMTWLDAQTNIDIACAATAQHLDE